jgi:hydroxypyruvate reductase/glycerate 2-kinase
MPTSTTQAPLRDHARAIWDAAVAAANPEVLVRDALTAPTPALRDALDSAERIFVVGAGKAGAAMAAGAEGALLGLLDRVSGIVNVPAECVRPLHAIRLHAARPAGTNLPTADGVIGARAMLELLSSAGSDDVALCLLSGGGSALLPAAAEGVTLEDKQQVTQLLHACGATINEMNCVRKHLSAVKGGRLAQAFSGKALFSLIISDVVGDPLDVIASGPTAADPTTFADARAVLEGYRLAAQVPVAVVRHLEQGSAGRFPETLKELPPNVHNSILGNNARALAAASQEAERLGYHVLNLGSFIQGETRHVASVFAGIVRSVRADCVPTPPPLCLLSGGETTVTLVEGHGQGGRNQEFVLAMLLQLGEDELSDAVVLSAGTDGEDGPTDAAGALADVETVQSARRQRLDAAAFVARNDAYHFFEATGGLLKSGLTGTNVMDVRIILVR